MREFKTYHPVVNLMYFVFAIGFSMFYMHPVCLLISSVCSAVCFVILKGKEAIKGSLSYIVPLMVVTALINPLFSHGGITVLTYFPGGNPLTLESVIYGFASALMIANVIMWFSCYNRIMTSDKFIYLFGKIIPSISLIISMALRFVPNFMKQFRVVSEAQRCMGHDISSGSIISRAKYGLDILSAVITWSMENAVETADSMKARGYGIPGRTSFSIFIFDKRDVKVLLCIILSGLYVLAGGFLGAMDFSYFPVMRAAQATPFNVSVFAAYILLLTIPVIIELVEVKKWKYLR